MSQSAKPHPTGPVPVPAPPAAEPAPPYRRIYAWVFQAWLVMFLGVVCVALIFYLWSYIPR